MSKYQMWRPSTGCGVFFLVLVIIGNYGCPSCGGNPGCTGCQDLNGAKRELAGKAGEREVETEKTNFWKEMQARFKGNPINEDGGLELTDWTKTSISLAIRYDKEPSWHDIVKTDTTIVALAAIEILVGMGRKPAEEWLTLSVRGYTPVKGVTGKDLWRYYGRAKYDCTIDNVKFFPAGEL
jgi:hypothetical protein